MAERSKVLIDAGREAFGQHPEDVISSADIGSDACGWLAAIFVSIQHEVDGDAYGPRIKRLAEAGAYIAQNMDDYLGGQYEEMRGALKNAGVISAETDRHGA